MFADKTYFSCCNNTIITITFLFLDVRGDLPSDIALVACIKPAHDLGHPLLPFRQINDLNHLTH
jgi:hypothetical protein